MRKAEKQLRAAGYIRVSTERQKKKGESLRTQRAAIETHVRRMGYRMVKLYTDGGRSGASLDKRSGLKDLLAQAEAGKFDLLIVHRLSRLGRNSRDLHNIIAQLNARSVALVSLKEQLDLSSPVGRVMFSMLSAIAEFEREVTHESMRENWLERLRLDEICPVLPPLGYIWNKEKRCLEIVAAERKTIRKIFELFLKGFGQLSIAYYLKREGYVGRNKRTWTNSAVRYVINNPIYVGRWEVVIGGARISSGRRPVPLPDAEVITIPAPPMIDEKTWEATRQAAQWRPFQDTRKRRYSEHWLRQSLECALCGSSIFPRSCRSYDRPIQRTWRRYVCRVHIMPTKRLWLEERKSCPMLPIDGDELEREVLRKLFAQLRKSAEASGNGAGLAGYQHLVDDIEALSGPDKQVLIEVLLLERIRVNMAPERKKSWQLGPMKLVGDWATLERGFEERSHLPIPPEQLQVLRSLVHRIYLLRRNPHGRVRAHGKRRAVKIVHGLLSQCAQAMAEGSTMSRASGDPNMAFALALGIGLGTSCHLPEELGDIAARARFVNRIDGPFIATYAERDDPVAAAPRIGQRMREIAVEAWHALPSIPDELDRLSVALRLWSGCLSAAKVIALETRSGPNTPDTRRALFEDFIDSAAESDSVFRAGVEAAPSFKALRGEAFDLEGVPANSPVRRFAAGATLGVESSH